MTHDEVAKQIAEDIDLIDAKIEDVKSAMKALKEAREDKIAELRNLAAGGGIQEDMFEEDGT